MRWILVGCVCLFGLVGCARRGIATVQRAHGREVSCDPRFVRVERGPDDRYVSRGCGFEADWECRSQECELLDLRSFGMGAP